jgi:hypothetical protein
MVLDTPTWRANLDWGARLGYDPISLAAVNRRAVEFVAELAAGRPAAKRRTQVRALPMLEQHKAAHGKRRQHMQNQNDRFNNIHSRVTPKAD